MQQLSPGARITGVYLVSGGLWLLVSDLLLHTLVTEQVTLAQLQTYRNWLFILITAIILYYILRAEFRQGALHPQEDHLRMLAAALEQSSESMMLTIPDALGPKIIFVNKAFTRLTGYQPEEVIGKTPLVFQGTNPDRDQFDRMRQQLMAGENFYGQLLSQRKDGSEFNVELRITAVRDARDTITHFVGIQRDITQQMKNEKQLIYQAELLQHVSDAIISTDMNMVIKTWNRAAEKIYGWTANEAIGQYFDQLIAISSATTQENTLDQIRATGYWQGEIRQKNKAGEALTILISANILLDAAGQPTGIVSINRDITRDKQIEDELQAAENVRIEFAKEKEMLEVKEQFISMFSHELRTPLTTVVTSTELIEHYFDRLTPEKRQQHLKKIRSQTDYMRKLLDDVLTVSKAQAGKVDFQPEALDLEAYCRNIVEEMQFAYQPTNPIVMQLEGDLQNILLDNDLLHHILANLLGNALKYSPDESEVRFVVSAQAEELVLQVSDQGIGIPEVDQPRLFEPFQRAGNTGSISGTGLGLAIVKDSVNLHGGSITFKSTEGEGTTFTVRLPLNRPQALD